MTEFIPDVSEEMVHKDAADRSQLWASNTYTKVSASTPCLVLGKLSSDLILASNQTDQNYLVQPFWIGTSALVKALARVTSILYP